MSRFSIAIAAALGVALAAPSIASAKSGTIKGRFVFNQHNGNYDSSTVGAKYPKSQYKTYRGVRYARLSVKRASDHKVLGNGSTDANGNFTVAWADSGSGNATVYLQWYPEHKDGRFEIRTTSGGRWFFPAGGSFTATNGGTVDRGTLYWGNSTTPNTLTNLYDAASKMWSFSLSQSNRMKSYFGSKKPSGSGATTYVQIRAWLDDGSCPTGAAWGHLNRICIPSSGALMPQARMMHEMGHIASYVSNRDQERKGAPASAKMYEFDADGDGNTTEDQGWSAFSAEWHHVQFEEAVATAFANVALYYPHAADPDTCLSAGECTTNLETHPSSCSSSRRRWEISAERYFWDVYDSNSDYTEDDLSQGVWHLADTIHAFDNGTGNRDKDEIWNSSYTSVVDKNGRSTEDFARNWKTWGTDSLDILTENCWPTAAD